MRSITASLYRLRQGWHTRICWAGYGFGSFWRESIGARILLFCFPLSFFFFAGDGTGGSS